MSVPVILRLPRRFFDDHADRCLPTPAIVRQDDRHVWVRHDDPDLRELLEDATFYADPDGPDEVPAGLKASARASVAAIQEGSNP